MVVESSDEKQQYAEREVLLDNHHILNTFTIRWEPVEDSASCHTHTGTGKPNDHEIPDENWTSVEDNNCGSDWLDNIILIS